VSNRIIWPLNTNSFNILKHRFPGVSVSRLMFQRLCGRRPCKELIHKPDVRTVCQMWLLCFGFLSLGESKWSAMNGFTGEDRFHSAVIGQIKQKQRELRETRWLERRWWVIMMSNDYTRAPLKAKLTQIFCVFSFQMYWVDLKDNHHRDFLGASSRKAFQGISTLSFWFLTRRGEELLTSV